MARINATDQGVRVEGLNELSRALRRMGPEHQKKLRETNRDVAGFVAADAATMARSIGGVAAKSAPSIRAVGRANAAGVAFGGSAAPYAGGAEFGANRFPQFKPWRGNGPDAGYFVYPTIRDDADRIETAYGDAFDDLARRLDLR